MSIDEKYTSYANPAVPTIWWFISSWRCGDVLFFGNGVAVSPYLLRRRSELFTGIHTTEHSRKADVTSALSDIITKYSSPQQHPRLRFAEWLACRRSRTRIVGKSGESRGL